MTGDAFYRKTANAIAAYLYQELKIKPGVHYRLRSAVSGPRVLTLALILNPRYAGKIITMSEQLSMTAGLDRDQSLRIGRGSGGTLILEVPKPQSLWYNVPLTALPRRRGIKAMLGLDSEHRPTLLDFTDPTAAHCLVAGATGSGKTNAQRLIFHNLALQNDPGEVSIILIDTRKRGIGWRPFGRLPHLAHPIITEEGQARQALAWAVAEIDRRSPTGRTRPRVFIGIDEAQALLENEELVKPISDLAAVGREFGLHLVTATQNPTADMLGDVNIKRNMIRLVGRVDSGDAARVAAGVPGSGAEHLTGAGDMLLVLPGQMRRLTTALLTEKDTAILPNTEAVRTLDFSEYEDLDHVLDVADQTPGRPPDPIEPEHVAYALAHPNVSQREMYRSLGIGFTKIKRVRQFAQAVAGALEASGHQVCQIKTDRNGATKRNNSPILAAQGPR